MEGTSDFRDDDTESRESKHDTSIVSKQNFRVEDIRLEPSAKYTCEPTY